MTEYVITKKIEVEPKAPNSARTYTANLASGDTAQTNDGGVTDTGFLQGRTVTGSTFGTSSPSGLTLDSDSFADKSVTFKVSGGVDKTDYELATTLTLSDSDTEYVVFLIPVRAQ